MTAQPPLLPYSHPQHNSGDSSLPLGRRAQVWPWPQALPSATFPGSFALSASLLCSGPRNLLLSLPRTYSLLSSTPCIIKVKVTRLCPTLCDPLDYTVHGILQARILEWVAFPFSRGSSQPRGQTQVSRIAGGFFTSWATREAQEYWSK